MAELVDAEKERIISVMSKTQHTGSNPVLTTKIKVMIILIIASIYMISCFFEKSDYERMKDAEKLPPFSKKDAERYYVELKKLNK